jgi:hypothetical protein
MNRRLTYLLLPAAVASPLLVKAGLTLAQGSRGTFNQGTFGCSVNPATKCGRVTCNNVTWFSNTVCNPEPSSQDRILCDSNVQAGCTITNSTYCSEDKSQLSFGYRCPDVEGGIVTSQPSTCPIPCEDCSGSKIANSDHTQCVTCPSPKVPNQEHNSCVCPSPAPTPPNCDTYAWIASECRYQCGSVGGMYQPR